jgi:inhibitor of KinA
MIPLGDAALLIDFGNTISEETNRYVLHLFQTIKQLRLPGITDVVPAFSSLAVFYDPVVVRQQPGAPASAFDKISSLVREQLTSTYPSHSKKGRLLRIPVCYQSPYNWDLADMATQMGLSEEEIIHLHTSITYRVYMIGFLPGFAYMGEVESRIAAQRRKEPRTKVAAGSVGIAGKQTGIYPVESPGGWQIIGRTPVRIFTREDQVPVLFEPGDEVNFYSITAHEFENYKAGII